MNLKNAPLWIFLGLSAAMVYTANLPRHPSLGFLLILLSAGLLLFAFPAPPDSSHLTYKRACLTLGLFGLALLFIYRIDAPWTDHRSFNGAFWSAHARNIARHGFIATKGILFFTGGPDFDPEAPIANHHPPGLAWMLAVLFKLFGPHEWVARMVPVAFSLAGAAAVLLLSLRRQGAAGAGCVLLAAAACPALTYLGRMVNFEPLVLALSLAFYAALALFPARRPGGPAFGFGCLAAAPLLGWAGGIWSFFAAGFLARTRRVRPRATVFLIPLAVLSGIALFLSYHEVEGVKGMLLRSLKWHPSFRSDPMPSWTQWLAVVGAFLRALVPMPLWFLVPLVAFRPIRRALPGPLLAGTLAPFALLLPVMPHAFYIHNYHVMSVWPLAALLAGAAAAALSHAPRSRFGLALALLLPLAMGMRTYADMHRELPFRRNETACGKTLNAILPAHAKMALVPKNKKFFSSNALFYMDRRYRTFETPEMALSHIASWDYCLSPKEKPLPPEPTDSPFRLTVVPARLGAFVLVAKTPRSEDPEIGPNRNPDTASLAEPPTP